MKKLLFFAAAALGMFAASCQKEPVNVVNDGKAVVTLSVEVPGAPQTRAIAQAENANIVYFEVWNSDWTKKLPVYMEDGTTLYESTAVSGRKANVELTLVADQTYNFIFWAQHDDCGAYSWETLKNVNVDYSVIGQPQDNNDVYDAYYAVKTIKVNGAINETVVLYRPFAQLNFGASRMATSFGPVDVLATEVTVTGLATTFNTIDGVGENETGAVTFAAEGIATTEEMLATENGEYTWIAMDYMLMLKDSDLVSVEASFELGMDVPVQHAIANVPLKKNYRTNIIGDLFAADAKLQIVIDQAFLKDDEGITVGLLEVPEYDKDTNTYTIEKPGHILWLSEKSNNGEIDFSGKTISFAADIDMMGQGFLPINLWSTKSVTILGNGYTVSDYAVRGDSWRVGAERERENAGLFGRVKGSIYDLNVKDVIVEGNYSAGALVGFVYGNVKECSAENVEINSIPYASIVDGTFIYDDGNNVGGLIGYVGENGYEVSDNTVTNAYLVGYRCIGGVIGTAQNNAVVNRNTVNNIELVVDQTYTPYVEESEDAYVGQIVGRMISTDDLSDNTVNEAVVTNTQTVATLEELQAAVDAAAASTWIKIVADIKGNVIIKQKEGVDLIIDGSANSYDGTFFIHGQARSNGAETLEFRNINFNHAGSELNFIESNSTVSDERYAHNVTVDGCTFTGDAKVVGLKIRQGFDITVKNSTVAGMHSLMQLYGTAGVTVDNVTIENSGRGIALGTSTDINISNVDFAVDSYGIRADGVTAALDLNNASIKANLPVVVRKLTAGNEYSIALSGTNVLTRGAAQNYDIVFTNGDDEEAFVVPEGKYSITGAEAFSVYPVDIQEIAVANAEELQDAIDNTRADIITLTNKVEKVGLSFEVSRDVIFNMNNYELNAGSTSSSTYYALEVQGENNVVINDANFTRAGVVAQNGADVVFNSGVIAHNPERTGRYMFVANHEGSTITVNDGTFINNTGSNKYFWADSNAIIYVKGGTYKGVASKTKIYTSNGGQVIITGGTFNFDPTTWVAEGYQAVKSGSDWTVQPK